MPLNIPTFLTRTASAVVFAAIMLTGLLWNEWAFFILIALIQFFCLNDYFRLIKKIYPNGYWPIWFPIFTQVIGFAVASINFITNKNEDMFFVFALLHQFIPALLCAPAAIILLTAGGRESNAMPILLSFSGLVYITLPLTLLLHLRFHEHFIPLDLILLIWVNDTMAYITGSFIGRTPFSEVSPKKTWEGTVGGIIFTIAIAVLMAYIFKDLSHITNWIIIALCASIAGTAGDLFESKLKRLADVKDSGNLMPGHGGALDRFDSLLVAIPFVFFYAYFFMNT